MMVSELTASSIVVPGSIPSAIQSANCRLEPQPVGIFAWNKAQLVASNTMMRLHECQSGDSGRPVRQKIAATIIAFRTEKTPERTQARSGGKRKPFLPITCTSFPGAMTRLLCAMTPMEEGFLKLQLFGIVM